MSYKVLVPAKSAEEVAKQAFEILDFARKHGELLDAEGFITAFIMGVKVLVEEIDGEIKTLAIASIGNSWIRSNVSASIFIMCGDNVDGMLDFIKTITLGAGGKSVYVLGRTPIHEDENTRQFLVDEYLVG